MLEEVLPNPNANGDFRRGELLVAAYKADKPDTENPVWSGQRPGFIAVLRGKKCYIPSRDDTVAGGSGSHRWNDPSTWEWTANAEECRYQFQRGIYALDRVDQPDQLLLGRGLSEVEAPPERSIAYAATCAEQVALDGGGTEDRYQFNGLINADESFLQAEGYSDLDTIALHTLTQEIKRLQIPQGTALAAARDRVRALPSGQTADFNHFYRAEQETLTPEPVAFPAGRHDICRACDSINWPRSALALGSCAVTVPIGMIDAGISTGHAIISGADLEVLRLADEALEPSKAIPGTAVASVLIGNDQSRVPGLIREARVVAVDAFGRVGSDERADLVSVLRGLDLLAGRDVRVINLSIAGSDNLLLRDTVNTLVEERGITIVAAAGNGGPRADPVFPSGYGNVIAVTAVDTGGRIYRRAQRGAHLDMAAPGVNLLAATSVRGARLKTGT